MEVYQLYRDGAFIEFAVVGKIGLVIEEGRSFWKSFFAE